MECIWGLASTSVNALDMIMKGFHIVFDLSCSNEDKFKN